MNKCCFVNSHPGPDRRVEPKKLKNMRKEVLVVAYSTNTNNEEKLKKRIDELEEELDKAKKAKKKAEDERDSANKAKKKAEDERDEAVKAKKKAEDDADDAERAKRRAEADLADAIKAKKKAEDERDSGGRPAPAARRNPDIIKLCTEDEKETLAKAAGIHQKYEHMLGLY